MLGVSSGIGSTDLSHAGALLIGIGIGVWVTLRVMREVSGIHREIRHHHKEDNDDDDC